MAVNSKTEGEQIPPARDLISSKPGQDQAIFAQQDKPSLAARLRSGDRTAAEKLVDLYYQRIYLYMRQLGHGRHTSEDLTQEVFMRAWYHIGQLRDNGALTPWLFRIAHNVSYQHKRWLGRRDWQNEPLDLAVQMQSEQVPVDEALVEMDQVRRLQQAICKLPFGIRQTVVLHYLQDLPISAAAQALGIREGTFKSRLHRALTMLRRELADDRPDLGSKDF